MSLSTDRHGKHSLDIVVCTHNRSHMLCETLRSLATVLSTAGVNSRVILVDNKSSDDTRKVVSSFEKEMNILYIFEQNLGLSFARNTALTALNSDYSIWIDDDVLLPRGWLTSYLAAFAANPDTALFGGPIRPAFLGNLPGWLKRNIRSLSGPYSLLECKESRRMECGEFPFGANMVVKNEWIKQLHFDTSGSLAMLTAIKWRRSI